MTGFKLSFIFKSILSAAVTLIMTHQLVAQTPDIEIDTRASGPVTVCGDAVTFTVTLKNITSTNAESLRLYPRMPGGMVYVQNSASGMTYGGNSPELFFEVGSLGTETGTNEKTVSFQAMADCNLITYLQNSGQSQTLVNNQTKITYTLNGDKELFEPNGSESYSVLFAELEVYTPQAEKNMAVEFLNLSNSRHIFIRNSGLGRLSSVDLYLKIESGLRLDKLELQTAKGPIILTAASTDPTLGYKFTINNFSGTGNGDAFLDEGEQVSLTDFVTATTNKSSIETVYTARWGCNNLVCNAGANQTSFSAYLSAIGGRATVRPTWAVITKTDYCNKPPAEIRQEFTNYGSGNAITGTDGAFNVKWLYSNWFFAPTSTHEFWIRTNDGSELNLQDYATVTYNESIIQPNTTIWYKTWSFNFNNAPALSVDIDGPGGLADLDRDGFFDDLPVGATLKFTIRVKHTFDGTVTDSHDDMAWVAYNLEFNHWSGEAGTITDATNLFQFTGVGVFSSSLTGPADLFDGVKAFKLWTEMVFLDGLIDYFNGSFEIEVDVPVGVELVGAKHMNRPLTVVQENGKYYIRDPLREGPLHLDFDFRLNCSISSENREGQIVVRAYHLTDPACTQSKMKLLDVTKNVYLHCGTCNGIQTTDFKVQRATFGWAPLPQNTHGYKYGDLYGASPKIPRVNASTPGVMLSRAMPKDDVVVTVTGVAQVSTDNLSVEINYESPFDPEAFEYVSASLTVGVTEHDLGSSPPTKVVDGRKYKYIFTVPIAITAQAALVFKARLRVRELPGMPPARYDVKVFRGTFTHQDANQNRIDCMGLVDDQFQIVNAVLHAKASPFQTGSNLTASGKIVIAELLNTVAGSFPNEFRPLNYLKSYVATLPKGFVFDTSKPLEAVYNTALMQAFDGVTYSQDKRTITLTLTDKMPVFLYHDYIYAHVKIDCSNPGNIFEPVAAAGTDVRIFNYSYVVNEYAYLPEGPHTPWASTMGVLIYNIRRSNLRMTANSEQEAYAETVNWPVQVTNAASGTSASTYSWLAVELQASDNSTIIDGVKDANGSVVPVVRYGPKDANHPEGRYVFISLGTLPVSHSGQYQVIGKYRNCNDGGINNINVYASWDPYAYPRLTAPDGSFITTSITEVKTCEGLLSSDIMAIKYKTSALQWAVTKQGPESVDLCTAVPFDIDLSSTKYADIIQPRLSIQLPEHVTIEAATAMYQYPYSNTALPIPAEAFSLENGQTVIDITRLTGGNLPGTRLTDNKIKLSFSLITSCGFDPGIPIRYTLDGYTNCGDHLTFVDQRKIRMNGVELDELELALSASMNPARCSNENVIGLTMKNNGVAPSSASRLEIILPEGTDYMQIVQSELGEPTQSQVGNQTKISWELPENYIATGATKSLSFKVFVTYTPEASTEISFEAHTYEMLNLNCSTDDTTCPTEGTSGVTKLVLPVTGLASLHISYEKYVCAYRFNHTLTDETELGTCNITSYHWDFGDGVTSAEQQPYHAFNPGTYTVSLSVTFSCNGCGGSAAKDLQLIVNTEDVVLETRTITFTTDVKEDVLQVSAATFSDAWPLSFDHDGLNETNSYLNGSEGVWRNDAAFVYQEERSRSTPVDLSQDGTFDIENFSWEHSELDAIPNWTRATRMTEYSPFSYELENRDVLGIYSAALYDYGGHLPSANGVNMRNREMAFTGFEFPDAESQSRFFNDDNGVTGNWTLGEKPVLKYTIFDVNVGERHVATVEATVAELEAFTDVDVLAINTGLFGRKSKFLQKNKILCRVQHPENPEWTVVVFERMVFDGFWTGKVRVKNNATLANNAEFDNSVVHSGRASLKVSTDKIFKQPLLRLESGKAYLLNAWFSINRPNVRTPYLADNLGIDIIIRNATGEIVNTFSFAPAGRIIEGWQQVKGSFVCPVAEAQVEIQFKSGSTGVAWYDDLRLHPVNGNMKSYVYDVRDYRLRAILDEENYASFFYYDQEGNLHITKKETEEGIKTLTENISHQAERP